MNCSGLYILVEGDDDETFFKQKIKPMFEDQYDFVKLWKYAQKTKKKVKRFVVHLQSRGYDYFFVGDKDQFPCVTAKKQQIQTDYELPDGTSIIVVITMIEGWYLGGLDDEACGELRLQIPSSTDTVTHEQFDSITKNRFDSRIDCMQELLKSFCFETAIRKNKSFKYFQRKYDL